LALEGVQALLFTSANGVRAFARQNPRRDVVAFAVGPATAAAARAAGFTQVEIAGGDVAALARTVARKLKPEAGRLIHVSGSDVAGDLAGDLAGRGFAVERAVLYEAAAPENLPQEAIAAIANGQVDGVLLYSPRTAEIFGALAGKAGLTPALRKLTAFCLSQSVAAAVQPLSFGRIEVAKEPTEAALLELLARPRS
jgi:uroporphyrinogen-III synthase